MDHGFIYVHCHDKGSMVPNYQSVNWVIRNAPILRCGDICNPLLSNLHEKLYREDDPIPSNVYIYTCIYIYTNNHELFPICKNTVIEYCGLFRCKRISISTRLLNGD